MSECPIPGTIVTGISLRPHRRPPRTSPEKQFVLAANEDLRRLLDGLDICLVVGSGCKVFFNPERIRGDGRLDVGRYWEGQHRQKEPSSAAALIWVGTLGSALLLSAAALCSWAPGSSRGQRSGFRSAHSPVCSFSNGRPRLGCVFRLISTGYLHGWHSNSSAVAHMVWNIVSGNCRTSNVCTTNNFGVCQFANCPFLGFCLASSCSRDLGPRTNKEASLRL